MGTGAAVEAIAALTAAGVSLVVETDGRLPRILHWGHALPGLAAPEAEALVASAHPLNGPNDVDRSVRLAILPESWTGWTGRPGIAGSRGGRAWSPRFQVTDIALDGHRIRGFVHRGPGALTVYARADDAALELELSVELLPSGLIRSRSTLTNLGADGYQVDAVTLAYPVPAEASELLDFAGRWGRERVPQRLPFGVGTHLRENRRGRTGPDSAFVLHAGTPGFDFATGDVYAVHTAWSGDHVHVAERNFNGLRVLGGGELLLPGEVRLQHGQRYSSPWLYGSHGVGLDAVAHRFHRHLRGRPRRVSVDRPVTLNVWEAVTFDHDLARLKDLADRAADVGVERFVLDDGWFGARRSDHAGLGDWVVSADVWPDGLHPLIEHVRAKGMAFGLWVEPEMVNVDSDVARAHPEWIMAAGRELPVESRHQQVLDLAQPGAYEHVRSQLLAVLSTYPIDYLKWDHNRDLSDAGDPSRGGAPGVHEQTLAAYRLMDQLRAAHPGLEIESCSSGGARIDLAVLERTDRVWVSDCIDPLERQAMNRWTGQLLPPEYLGSHIASGRSHTTGRLHDLSFRAGTALFGHLGIEWDLAIATDEEMADLRAWVAFWKAHRGLLMGGDVVRMDVADAHRWVHGVVAGDRSEALIALVTTGSQDAAPGPPMRFRGLEPAATYQLRPVIVGRPPSGLRAPAWWGPADPTQGGPAVVHRGITLSGAALAHVGVAPPIVHPDQVVLFHARRVESPTD